MEVKINSVHFSPDKKLVDFVNKKVSKLDTFFDGIINAEVTLKVMKPEASKNKISELKPGDRIGTSSVIRKQGLEEMGDAAIQYGRIALLQQDPDHTC